MLNEPTVSTGCALACIAILISTLVALGALGVFMAKTGTL